MHLLLMALLLAAPDPTTLVNPFIGTSGTQQGGPIDTFPGADVPFGMLQWSPDTPSQNAGGGYEYNDRATTGFSVTHLSGPGCNVFGDFAILPTLGSVNDPAQAEDAFSHAHEQASPGWYALALDNGVAVALTVTPRTGLGSFTFPAGTAANLLVNASSDQAGVTAADVHVVGNDEVTGSATSGAFCGMPDAFTVYFAARFDRPFSAYGTWRGASATPGSSASRGAGSGAWVTFDTARDTVVKIEVAISYVSVAGALANLRAENRGWDLNAVHAAALRMWRNVLGRIAISGATPSEQTTFYTALYHAMLHPNVYSDANGRYRGFDGNVHRVRPGHVEYANYSDWDVYRSQIPLVALLDPDRAGDMMQSLVDAAQQSGALPRWALVNAPTSVMGGDSVDAVLAGGYAFGARGFDVRRAVAAMVRGASDPDLPRVDGWYVERPELAEYLRHGYVVNTHTTSVAPVPNGASETLEYALDDFSIAQLARAADETRIYREFLRRSSNWENVFDTATGLVAPRDRHGAFMQTPVADAGQSGFQEGNAAQYTWMVPQDPNDLIAAMGGRAQAQRRLDAFFTQLDAGQNLPYAWLGNEPSLGSPWIYLSAGEPWRTQAVVRRALLTLYADTPVGLPGNDDLGEMSAWYVWCAIGLYPQNPAMRFLDVGSPLFARVVITAPNGPTIAIDAPAAADDAPYVQSLSINGRATQQTWLELPLHGNVDLAFVLGAVPNEQWGTASDDAPPSFAGAAPRFPPASAVTLSLPAGVTSVAPGASAAVQLALANPGTTAQRIAWHVTAPDPLRVEPSSGASVVPAGEKATVALLVTAGPQTTGAYETVRVNATAASGALLQHAAAVVRVGAASAHVALAFLENIYDNSVTPVDLSTGALLPKIAVGSSPRDGIVASNGMLFVADRDGATVSVVDPRTRTVVKTIDVGRGPSALMAAADGTLWFVNAYGGTVQSIDPRTQTASVPIAVGGTLRSVAIAGTTLYVTVQSQNEVVPIDMRTRALGTPIAVGRTPEGIAATPDGRRLYVVDHASNEVTPIDVASGRALPAIRVGIAPVKIAVAPDGRTAYVGDYGVNTVTPIDLTRDTAGPPIPVGGEPYDVAVSTDGSTLWVVNHEDNDLVPVSITTRRAGTPIDDPNGPLTVVLP
jgi:predicted alpha-1,2-mannosidase